MIILLTRCRSTYINCDSSCLFLNSICCSSLKCVNTRWFILNTICYTTIKCMCRLWNILNCFSKSTYKCMYILVICISIKTNIKCNISSLFLNSVNSSTYKCMCRIIRRFTNIDCKCICCFTSYL